jgi:ADP-heptose:LPS heptosyltransferase
MSSIPNKSESVDTSNIKVPSPKRVLLVQLNRFGDLIQTATIARELKTQRPDLRVDLVARKIFSERTSEILNECFDNVYQVGMDTFLNGKTTLDASIQNLTETIQEINNSPTTILINQSFSKSSAVLCSLISSQFKFGMYADKQGEICIKDKWSQYIHANVMTGNYNDIHLNDIFRLMIGTFSTARQQAALNTESRFIAINPFSSHPKKSWRLEKWTEIIYQILKRDSTVSIRLLGSPAENEELQKISKLPLLNSFHDRISINSKQTIYETYSLIRDSRLYLGHDSLCSNLAALAQRKSVIISLGTVRTQETFPDSLGNYILSPRTACYPCFPDDACTNYKCHSDINFNVVVEVTSQVYANGSLSTEKLHKNLNEFQLSATNIYESVQLPSNLLSLKNLSESKLTINEYSRGILRISWLYLFEELSESFGSNETVYPELSVLQSFQGNISQLFDLCQHGTNFSRYILEEISKTSPCLKTIRDYGAKIDEIDQLIGKVQAISPILTPICQTILLKKSQLEPGHLVQLTEQTFLIYNKGVSLCRMITELNTAAIEKTQNCKRNITTMADV